MRTLHAQDFARIARESGECGSGLDVGPRLGLVMPLTQRVDGDGLRVLRQGCQRVQEAHAVLELAREDDMQDGISRRDHTPQTPTPTHRLPKLTQPRNRSPGPSTTSIDQSITSRTVWASPRPRIPPEHTEMPAARTLAMVLSRSS
jgi:hypothetical protein